MVFQSLMSSSGGAKKGKNRNNAGNSSSIDSGLFHDEDGYSTSSSQDGFGFFNTKRMLWVAGMIIMIVLSLYTVLFKDPGRSIHRGTKSIWKPPSNNNNNNTNGTIGDGNDNTTSIINETISLLPSTSPTMAPTIISEMVNSITAYMIIHPLSSTLTTEASFAWALTTSNHLQSSIVNNGKLNVIFLQTQIIQEYLLPSSALPSSVTRTTTSLLLDRKLQQQQQQQRQQQRILEDDELDTLVIKFEVTFFSGTFPKRALEQEVLHAFSSSSSSSSSASENGEGGGGNDGTKTLKEEYISELQKANEFFQSSSSSAPIENIVVTLELDLSNTPAPIAVPTTPRPTLAPTTKSPTLRPTTKRPTVPPTPIPTASPTKIPSSSPTSVPTITPVPTATPLTILGEFEVIESVPHDITAFTQGLELVSSQSQNLYYESVGLYGEGAVRIVELQTGRTIQEMTIDNDDIFAFGLTRYNNQLIQLTWRAGFGYLYDASNLSKLGTFPINTTNGEGWGICHDTTVNTNHLYVSDGTIYLHTWDATSKELLSKVAVTQRTDPNAASASTVRRVNELEWDRFSNTILANVWQKDYIIRIDPMTGFVTHNYDLSSLDRPGDANVLNGIAITNVPNEIWVTGKLWPNMYRIRLLDG